MQRGYVLWNWKITTQFDGLPSFPRAWQLCYNMLMPTRAASSGFVKSGTPAAKRHQFTVAYELISSLRIMLSR